MHDHHVRDLAVSALVSHPFDSTDGISAMVGLSENAEAGVLGVQALQPSLYVGWRHADAPGSSYGAGVSLSNSATGSSVTAILTWEHRLSPTMHISSVLPAWIGFSWTPVPTWNVGVRQMALGGSWLLDSSRSLQCAQVSLDLFARRRLGMVALEASAGWMYLDMVKYVENDRSAITIYGYDVFSSLRSRSLPNRMGGIFRFSVLFPAGE